MATAVTYSVRQVRDWWDTRCHLCASGGMGYATEAGARRSMMAHYLLHHEADVLAGVWSADDLALMNDRHGLAGKA